MATSALQTTYRQEIIAGFDKTVSVLRDTVITDYMDKGGSAVFAVADSINQTARTRGLNGMIPADPLVLAQNTATLSPWHKLVTVNDFNMFASQGNLAEPMKAAVMAAINRQIDDEIISVLATGSLTTGAATTGSAALILKAKVTLGNNRVPNDGNLTLLGTPALISGYLMQSPEFTSADYVSARPLADGGPAYGDKRMVYKWNGMTVIEDPTLPGAGTATEQCFLYHKNAVGNALNKNALEFDMDYDRQQKYSWANCSAYIGTKLLQNNGVVIINHVGNQL